MYSVWKYTLRPVDEQTLDLPAGAKILSVAEQRGQIVLYAMVTPTQIATVPRRILTVGTGHPMDEGAAGLVFVGTVKLLDGDLMVHIFTDYN